MGCGSRHSSNSQLGSTQPAQIMTKQNAAATEKPDEDEDEESSLPDKNLTAEQQRESKQLRQLNDHDLKAVRPDEQLALEAKIFVALEAQEHARRVEKEKELAAVKLTVGSVEWCVKETRLDKNEAEKSLKMNKGDLNAALIEFVTSFPHFELCRSASNVLGV